jgi:hypothetical protein
MKRQVLVLLSVELVKPEHAGRGLRLTRRIPCTGLLMFLILSFQFEYRK